MLVESGIFDSGYEYKGKKATPLRTVTKYELELCLVDGGVGYIDGKPHKYKNGIVICAKPGQKRYSILPYRCEYLRIISATDELCELLESLPNTICNINDTRLINDFHEGAVAAIEYDFSRELFLHAKALSIIARLCEATHGKKAKSSVERGAVQKALTYIEENFNSNISLCHISDYVNLSPVYFHKLFLEATGTTLHKYLLDKRIFEAKRLLLSTDRPMSEISYEVGFSSQSHFNFAFKNATGTTPKGFKKTSNEKYFQG